MSYLTFPHPALRAAAAAAIIAAGAMAGAAETGDSRYMTPTMINARAHMFDPNLNWMTFQHLDQMFATRTVTASAETWEIPQSDLTLDGEFTVNGETYDLDGALEATSGNALVVLKDGKLVSETYRNGSDASTRFLTFSVAKSYVATLIGLAVTDGLIDSIDDPVTKYLPELAGSGYDGATIEDLLRMRSGVEWLEVYEFGSDTQLTHVHDSALVGYEYRWCDYARDQSVKSDAAPGARFNYATLDTSVLGCILESVVDGTGAEYMARRLWQPLGVEHDAYWIMDGPPSVGREFYGAGLAATARDHARFGQMILEGGMANGRQVVPAAWVTAMTVPDAGYGPSEPDSDVGYQYQWWTFPDSNAFSAEGLFHQFIWISPDDGVVIVKTTATPEPVGHDAENLDLFQQIADRLTSHN
jgi:CubicO group peptidase (beta-lactamase class C family)